jgi:UDP-N-acetylmuramoylalanine--D-glutamate ligase
MLGFKVVVADTKGYRELASSINQLKGLKIKYVLGKACSNEIKKADLIIKNPGIPQSGRAMQIARKYRKVVVNDADVFLNLAPRQRIIGITGTKGKTTTAMLIKHILGSRAILVGVPGVSFFEYFWANGSPKWIVAEFSSFDLEYTKLSASMSVVTSLFPDHLNRYPSFASYAKTKMKIIANQKVGDIAVVWKSENTKKYLPNSKAKVIWASMRSSRYAHSWNIATPSVILACKIAKSYGVKDSVIRKKLKSFKAPRGRLEVIAKKKGITFINDTASTNPGSAAYSVERLSKEFGDIVIITGGEDKNFPGSTINFFATILKKYSVRVVLLRGSFSKRLAEKLKRPYVQVDSMNEAVKLASHNARVVALVPGAASFNMFKNEFDRAQKFDDAIQKLHT